MPANSSFTHQLVIPAGGILPIPAAGRFFRIVRSNVPLQIQRSGSAYQPYEQGDCEELAAGETFDRLEVKNATATDAYVQIYVGFGRRDQDRNTVMEPPTELRSLFAGNMAPNEVFTIAAPAVAGDLQRKAILVANGSNELRVNILTAGGAVASFVPKEQAHTFPVSGPMGVQNPSGVPLEVYISEIVYRA